MAKDTPIKVYVTKYALTDGIQEYTGRVCRDISDDMIDCGQSLYFHGKDWHRTRESAEKRVREMVAAKLKAIEKQRAKVIAIGRGLGMDV